MACAPNALAALFPTVPIMTKITVSFLEAKGNISEAAKNGVAEWSKVMCKAPYFANDILQNLEVIEMNIIEGGDELGTGKKQAQMVFELDVTEDLCNPIGSLHGGCTAALVDQCTSMVIALLSQYISPGHDIHVSVALNTTFHAPAMLGTRIRIISTTVASGKRLRTAKTEIYDQTRKSLVATGLHIKIAPSMSKL
ncbi:HotDog domain-containing protein [Irpex rosettiformis]|uniref:HotDog domain-containing protein n=1 Tax=Irpex rosettiformis TaxID=378272 RepID=A0ACB8UCQ0_9APHY|nr:HotDog domain-containing protein [Irpex rosettiformis]